MKILYLTYYWFPHASGGTWSTYEIASILAQKHKVYLLAPNVKYNPPLVFDYPEKKLNLSFVRVPSFPLPSKIALILSGVLLFLEGLKHKNVDVILSQYHPHHLVSFAAIILSKFLKKKVAVRADDIYRDIFGIMERKNPIIRAVLLIQEKVTIRFSDLFFIVCDDLVKDLQDRHRSMSEKIGKSPNGINTSILDEAKKMVSEINEIFEQYKNRIIIVYIGLINPEYGLDKLVKAIKILIDQFPNILLLMLGDGKEFGKISELVKEMQLEEYVKMLGFVTRKKAMLYLAGANIGIGPLLPTRALPLKVLEYFYFKKPVLVGEGSLSSELGIDGYNCLIAEPKMENLAEATRELITNKDLRKKLGENAYNTVLDYRWESVAKSLEKHLSSLIKR